MSLNRLKAHSAPEATTLKTDARMEALIGLIASAGGALSQYDERLEPFEHDGTIDAAIDAGRAVRTPTTIELAGAGDDRPLPVWAQLLAAAVAAAVFILIAGESLNWWNLQPYDSRRGDWRIAPR